MTPKQTRDQTNFDRQYKHHGLLCKLIMTQSILSASTKIGITDRTATNILRKFGYPVGYKSITSPASEATICNREGCKKVAATSGLCSAHYQEKYAQDKKWSGRLRMGLRLSPAKKRHAEAVGSFLEPVRIMGKI